MMAFFIQLLHFTCRYYLVITLLLLLTITLGSLWPAGDLPKVQPPDKLLHFLAYAGLAIPVAIRKPRYFIYGLIFLLCYSGVIELIQPYVGRSAEWLDWVANSAGIMTGSIVGLLLKAQFL